MAFGAWDEGNLGDYSDREALRDRLQKYSKRKFGKGTSSHVEAWNFLKLEAGSLVVLYGERAIIAMGVVTGPYHYDPNNVYVYDTGDKAHFSHIRPVKWIKTFDPPVREISQHLLRKLSKPSDTLHEIKDHRYILELMEILAHRY
jgi:predicted Mrr-cat superfamily restriction endonuclease